MKLVELSWYREDFDDQLYFILDQWISYNFAIMLVPLTASLYLIGLFSSYTWCLVGLLFLLAYLKRPSKDIEDFLRKYTYWEASKETLTFMKKVNYKSIYDYKWEMMTKGDLKK